MAGWWERLKEGMTRTRTGIGDRIRGLVTGREWSDDVWETLEQILFEADLGVATVDHLLTGLREAVRRHRPQQAEDVLALLEQEMVGMLGENANPYALSGDRPVVWLMVGVNGTGKTTTAGKLAYQMKNRGHQVILGAGDTFRAAAVEQLMEWGRRSGVDVVRQTAGADPAAVAFDTVRAAVARRAEVAIIDTAGRLHNKAHLMQELGKISRIIGRELPGAPQEVWLVIDATTGQNGLAQAQVFLDAVRVTGIVLTKLDGTAKGGIAFAIYRQLGLPIRFIGVGESADDLMPFNPAAYVRALIGGNSAAP